MIVSIENYAEGYSAEEDLAANDSGDKSTSTSKEGSAREGGEELIKGTLGGGLAGSEKRDKRRRLLSRDLAVGLNGNRPDFSGAMILYGLYLWQICPVRSFSYVPVVAGKRGAYRSLSELQAEYPWLSEEGIRQTLKRAERVLKDDFIVDRKNFEADRGKLHFRISDRLIKKFGFKKEGKKGFIEVEIQDVVDHGELGAILLANLRYVTDEKHNSEPLRDERGNIYRELSATKLTKVRCDRNADEKAIIPRSRKAVSEAIGRLKACGAIIEHSEKPGFYRLKMASDDVTRVASCVTNVADAVTRVAGQKANVSRKANNDGDLCEIVEMPDTNTYPKSDTKCLSTSTVSRCSPVNVVGEKVSAGGKKLMELVSQNLSACAHVYSSHRKVSFVGDEFCEGTTLYLPNSDLEVSSKSWHEDLPYDIISVHPGRNFAFSRKVQIDEALEEFISNHRIFGVVIPKQEIADLRALFEAHPHFQLEHLEELFAFTQPQRNGEGLGQVTAVKKGWDFCYWALRVHDLKTFLRYRRQLIREWYVYNKCLFGWIEDFNDDREGPPRWDYSGMEEPYFSLAFADEEKIPVTYEQIAPYDCIENPHLAFRPVYYAEFVGEPTVVYVEHDCNPIGIAA